MLNRIRWRLCTGYEMLRIKSTSHYCITQLLFDFESLSRFRAERPEASPTGRAPGTAERAASYSCVVAAERAVILDDRDASASIAEKRLARAMSVSALLMIDLRDSSLPLERLSAAVAALRMLDVFGFVRLVVLLLEYETGRS